MSAIACLASVKSVIFSFSNLCLCSGVMLYFSISTPTTHYCIFKLCIFKPWKQKLYVFENPSFAVRLTNVLSISHFKWLDVYTSFSQQTLYSQAVGVEKYKMSVGQQKESVKRTGLGLDSPYVVKVRYV